MTTAFLVFLALPFLLKPIKVHRGATQMALIALILVTLGCGKRK